MIPYANIKADIASVLDSEGNDRYIDQLDYVPAINRAQDYLCSLIAPRIGVKKFNEEVLRGLIATRIFQPSIYSRINVDGAVNTWGLMSIYVNPVIAIPPAPTSPWAPTTPPSADQSLLQPSYVYVSGGQSCRRLNSQEWASNAGNPLLDSYVPTAAEVALAASTGVSLNLNYGYITHIDNESVINPAQPYEITIRPYITSQTPVAITYLKYPARVVYPALGPVDWNPVFQMLLVKASCKFIVEKDGSAAKELYKITERDIEEILQIQS